MIALGAGRLLPAASSAEASWDTGIDPSWSVTEAGVGVPTPVPDDTFERTLEYAARSLRAHGFRDIVLLGDHGGYQRDLKVVAERLNREWAHSPARVHAPPEYYRASQEGFAALLRQRGYRDDEIGTHAALADASLMLAIDPGAVRTEALKAATPPGPAQGVYGDPRRASAQLGRLGVEQIVSQTVTAIRADVARRTP